MKGFDDFDELMRLKLSALSSINVDFDKFPYGKDNGKTGIYLQKNGEQYFLGPKQWIAGMTAVPTFLTTEEVVAQVIMKAFAEVSEKAEELLSDGAKLPNKQVYRLDLEADGVFPVHVPVVFDSRARADWNGKKPGVTDLALSIAANDPNAIVIANGVSKISPQILTFQRMKGLNGLEGRNIYIVLTWLPPQKYAELNVLSQWLGSETTIYEYHQDQINQAVGRNRGFRQSDEETTTIIIASRGLWNGFLHNCHNSRVKRDWSNEKLASVSSNGAILS
jgi:hypothetical protein